MAVTTQDGATGIPVAPSRPKKGSVARQRGRAGLLFVAPWIIGFLLWYLIPMVLSLWYSFTDFNLVSTEPAKFIGLDNWEKLFTDPQVRNSALVTVKFAALALPVAILFPTFIAYLLVSKGTRWRGGFRSLFFLPSIIPFVAAVLIFGGILNPQIGWANRILGHLRNPGQRLVARSHLGLSVSGLHRALGRG